MNRHLHLADALDQDWGHGMTRLNGTLLIAAASVFWLSWLWMPGVGVTDAGQIFALIGSNRDSVMRSVIAQLVSAALYVPALLGIASTVHRSVRWGAGLLLLGAMGSGMDAILHLLAYAMTAPGLDTAPSIPVMAYMQGPGLLMLAPFILAFFAGTIWLSVTLRHKRSLLIYGAAIVFVAAGGMGVIPARLAGLAFLGLVSLAQAWIGFAFTRKT